MESPGVSVSSTPSISEPETSIGICAYRLLFIITLSSSSIAVRAVPATLRLMGSFKSVDEEERSQYAPGMTLRISKVPVALL